MSKITSVFTKITFYVITFYLFTFIKKYTQMVYLGVRCADMPQSANMPLATSPTYILEENMLKYEYIKFNMVTSYIS